MTARCAGPVEARVLLQARRLTLSVRTVVAPLAACLGILVAPQRGPAAAVAAVFVAWHVMLVWGVVRGRVRLAASADVVVLAAVCAAQLDLLPPQLWYGGGGWVVATTSTAVITAQGYLRPVSGALFGVGVAVAFVGAAALHPNGDWRDAIPHSAWLLVETFLGRILMDVVGRSARGVDLATAAATATRQRVLLATARRDDARYQSALLHDTVAATLTAAAAERSGHQSHEVVAVQARRDLAMLDRGDLDPVAGRLDPPWSVDGSLVDRLAWAAHQSPLEVDLDSTEPVPVLPETVVSSMVGATREALRNVERHAGVRQATVMVAARDSHVEVTVLDRGYGFDPDRVAPHRSGIALSIEERMRRVGGRARILSTIGRGTRVLLTWPDRATARGD